MRPQLELRIELRPEELEGGYTRYTSDDLPGFSVLCEPTEHPLTLIQDAMTMFMPPMFATLLKSTVALEGLRIISGLGPMIKRKRAPITVDAQLSQA